MTTPAAAAFPSLPDPAARRRMALAARLRFYLYLLRHGAGVLVFAGLTSQAWRLAGPPMAVALGVLGLAYGVFALVSARRLWTQWRRHEETARLAQAISEAAARQETA